MKKVFVLLLLVLSLGVSLAYAQYPHVPKKNGTYDARANDLWELAQDYVFYRNRILKLAREGDQAGAAKARASFEQVNRNLNEYRQEDVSAAISQAESVRGGR